VLRAKDLWTLPPGRHHDTGKGGAPVLTLVVKPSGSGRRSSPV
jgi:hypothetical protein